MSLHELQKEFVGHVVVEAAETAAFDPETFVLGALAEAGREIGVGLERRHLIGGGVGYGITLHGTHVGLLRVEPLSSEWPYGNVEEKS